MKKLLFIICLVPLLATAQRRFVFTPDAQGNIYARNVRDSLKLTALDTLVIQGSPKHVKLDSVCLSKCVKVPLKWDTARVTSDTIYLVASYTAGQTPKVQKYKWMNKDRGGIINLPAASNAESAGLVIYLWNSTGQPLESNRSLYTQFASGHGHNKKPAQYQGVFLQGGQKITVVSGKYKVEKI